MNPTGRLLMYRQSVPWDVGAIPTYRHNTSVYYPCERSKGLLLLRRLCTLCVCVCANAHVCEHEHV